MFNISMELQEKISNIINWELIDNIENDKIEFYSDGCGGCCGGTCKGTCIGIGED